MSRCFAENGAPRLRPDGSPVFRTLLFPKAPAAMTDIWHVIGLRGTGSDSYTVNDLFVPEDHAVERSADARPREPGLLYAFSSSNVYSAGFAGVALGIARGVIDGVCRARPRQDPARRQARPCATTM